MARPNTPEKNTGPSMFATVLLTILWYVSSMLAITTSKLTMEAVKVPLLLCSAQFATATLVSSIVLATQGGSLKTGKDGLSILLGLASTYTFGFFLTNMAFSLAHASFVETVKSGEPISTVVLAFVLLSERERFSTYVSLLPVVVGVGMASSGEAGGGLPAFLVTVASNFCFSARAVFAKQLKKDAPTNPAASSDVSLFFQISWMGLLALLPLAAFVEFPVLVSAMKSTEFDATRFFGIMALNGLMYTAYNQFSFMVLSRVSTATHAVLNVCRRVCVIGVASSFFGTPLNVVNVVGIVVAVLGMVWFTRAKTAVTAAKKKD